MRCKVTLTRPVDRRGMARRENKSEHSAPLSTAGVAAQKGPPVWDSDDDR